MQKQGKCPEILFVKSSSRWTILFSFHQFSLFSIPNTVYAIRMQRLETTARGACHGQRSVLIITNA